MPAKITWTKKMDKAASLLSRGENESDIARVVGIAYLTLWRWKQRPDFQAHIQRFREEWHKELSDIGLADIRTRVEAANERHRRLWQIVEERSKDSEMQGVPGGTTGFLTRHLKVAGSGQTMQIFWEFEVDVALLREMRENEKQVAMDLGQWTEHKELTGRGGGPIEQTITTVSVDVASLTDEQLGVLEAILSQRELARITDIPAISLNGHSA